MRETRSHLCTVTESGEVIGLITLNDVLERLLQSSNDDKAAWPGLEKRPAARGDR